MNDHERKCCTYIYGEILRDPPNNLCFVLVFAKKNKKLMVLDKTIHKALRIHKTQ